MADNGNLKKGNPDTQFRSGQEAVENGRKGGYASGASRRKKGAAKRILSQLLTLKPNLSEVDQEAVKAAGIDPEAEDLTNEVLIQIGLMRRCMSGDPKAIELYMAMFGEDPKTLIEEKRLKMQREAVNAIRNSDGFMEAMKEVTEEVFGDGGDTPESLEDGE